MLEQELLLNYGVLGVWTITLLYDRYITQKQMKNVIERNTEAIGHVYRIIDKCKGVK